MIETKEDLHLTFIDGSCEELKSKLMDKVKEFKLEVNPFATNNIAIGIDLNNIEKPDFYQVEHNGDDLAYYKQARLYKELTLADFEEEETTKDTEPQYRYKGLEVESIFELQEPLNGGNLVYGDQKKPLRNQWAMMKILVEDKHQIYLREEVKWQEELLKYIEKVENSGEVPENVLCISLGEKLEEHAWTNWDTEEFLGMCRVALRATGELK